MDNKSQTQDIYQDIGYIRGIIEGMDNKLDGVCRKYEEHGKEIEALKVWQGNVTGRFTIVGVIVGIVSSGIISIIRFIIFK